jgi:tetratricopeptide (TPR) repeat protein
MPLPTTGEVPLTTNKAIQLDPDYADAYNHRGDAYRRLGQNQNTIADYTMAIELESDEDAIARYYHQLGLTCSALDRGRTPGDSVEPC